MRPASLGVIICSLLIGCGVDGGTQPQAVLSPPASGADESIVFADRQWALVGPAEPGTAVKSWMRAACYTSGDENLRLIDQQWDQDRHTTPVAMVRILRVEARRNGRWVSHGPTEAWFRDGGRSESYNVDGQHHGISASWFPNGQMSHEVQWVHGQKHGRSRGWHRSGSPSYEAIFVNGREASGQSWPDESVGKSELSADASLTRSQ